VFANTDGAGEGKGEVQSRNFVFKLGRYRVLVGPASAALSDGFQKFGKHVFIQRLV